MQMKKKIKEEKASVSVYVFIVLFTYLIILSSIYFTLISVNKAQLKTILKIKQSYELDNGNAEQIYQDRVNAAPAGPAQKEFSYECTKALQTFTAPADGIYSFELAGASGAGGNVYGTSYTAIGGKGAKIEATFTLKEGDIIDLVIGEQGMCTQATANDGTSGGGGGGTFAFKQIDTITDTKYQFTKGSVNYETLLAVAGGGGSQDVGYKKVNSTGYDGEAKNYKSPSNYTAYSTQTNAGTSSSSGANTMGISQFISYNAVGSFYTRGSGRAQGGYGGGGSEDDNWSYGGGWCNGTNTYQATSWSLDTSATGTDGANTGNGYAKITWLRYE